MRQVVRDRAADDAAADDDDPGSCGQFGHRGIIPCHAKSPDTPELSASDAAAGNLTQTSRGVGGSGTVGHVNETTLRGLYATVPTEFVKARNALVKELRRAKERDEAALVGALRRPDWTDWALNVVAAEHTAAVGEFATAAGDVRDAQAAAIEGRAGLDVRAALRTLRERTTDVSRKAAAVLEHHGRAPGTAELTARLSEIAGHATTTDQLRTGVLGSGEPDASDPFGGLEPADRPTPRRDAPAKRAAAAKRTAASSTKTDQPTSTQRAPSAAELKRIKRDQDRAEQARKAAARELAGADAELEKATTAVATAREKLADAERRQADATERRLAAEENLAQAEAAIESITANS